MIFIMEEFTQCNIRLVITKSAYSYRGTDIIRHFSTSADISGQFGTGAFDTGPKCPGSKVSWHQPENLPGGPWLSGLVHEEDHPSFPYFAQPPLESTNTGSTNCLLVQLIPSIDYSIREKILTAVPCTPKFN